MLAPIGGQGIALDATHVYFTTWSPGGVHKVAKHGGPVVDLASSPSSSYTAVWGDRVYWSSQGENLVLSVSTSGGAPEVVFESATPYGIAADAAGVYWAEFSGGSIWMLPTGETVPIRLASGQFSARDLAFDEQTVYWTNDASYSAVSKVAKP